MVTRRQAINSVAMGSAAVLLPGKYGTRNQESPTKFRYCLNTSTISGLDPGLLKYIEIASKAGYNGIELWVRDIKKHLDSGFSLDSIKVHLDKYGIRVESAIGFAPWLANGDEGFEQMEEEMTLLAALNCRRIAAPPAGVSVDKPLDLFIAGEKYSKLLDLGRKTGVMPQLEFWGASPVLWHLGQALMIAAVADDPDVRILPDIYHMFRGGSGFETLKFLDGNIIEIFHMNDYPGNIERKDQVDADRVFPGDGVAPLGKILKDLNDMGGEKVLSLELFNKTYWSRDPIEVAREGLKKIHNLVDRLN